MNGACKLCEREGERGRQKGTSRRAVAISGELKNCTARVDKLEVTWEGGRVQDGGS
jgi:hypothetical protein